MSGHRVEVIALPFFRVRPIRFGVEDKSRNAVRYYPALQYRLTRVYKPTPICDGNSFGATDRI
jgi:hypothetical protein